MPIRFRPACGWWRTQATSGCLNQLSSEELQREADIRVKIKERRGISSLQDLHTRLVEDMHKHHNDQKHDVKAFTGNV